MSIDLIKNAYHIHFDVLFLFVISRFWRVRTLSLKILGSYELAAGVNRTGSFGPNNG